MTTYIDVNVPKSYGAIGDEASVDGVEVSDAFHVGDEGSHADHEDEQDGPNDARMKSLILLHQLFAKFRLNLLRNIAFKMK